MIGVVKRIFEMILNAIGAVIAWSFRADDEADAIKLRKDIYCRAMLKHEADDEFPSFEEFCKVYTINQLRDSLILIKADVRNGVDPAKSAKIWMSSLLFTQPRAWRRFFYLDVGQ